MVMNASATESDASTAPAKTGVVPLLDVANISKGFPGVQALQDVSLSLGKGEILAVIGENGAGKSTLMKILAGVQKQDTGTIKIDGNEVEFDDVQDSLDAGIALIHQELNLADNLNVAGNIFLGREPKSFGFINERQMRQDAASYLQQVGLEVSPKTPLKSLPIGQQQLVEIAKALSINARVLIMDEPTSSLSHKETENLFRVAKGLRCKGVSLIYISHRLAEVEELADRVVVLRDGTYVGELKKNEIERPKMVSMMVGRDIDQYYDRKPHAPGETVLEVKEIVTPDFPGRKVSFSIRAGEIVGMAGLVGAGRTELLQVLFGINPPLSGELQANGKPVRFYHPADAIKAGIALVPEDRKQDGLILEESILRNSSLPSLHHHRWSGCLVNNYEQTRIADDAIGNLRIKTPSAKQIVQLLSGGNQQKVVLGKWLAMKPKLLLLDEPTRGIDVGAKEEIYHLMDQLAEEGMAILFVSSEMDEVLGMSDRVLVMHEGKLTGELKREELSEEAVMTLATGTSLTTVNEKDSNVKTASMETSA